MAKAGNSATISFRVSGFVQSAHRKRGCVTRLQIQATTSLMREDKNDPGRALATQSDPNVR